MRKRLPTANELVYDYGTSLVIGYSPTDRGVESIVSTAARADGVRPYLMHGPQLPDPKKLLMGTGKQTRYLQVEAASQLKQPDDEALISAAIDRAAFPLPSEGRGGLVMKTMAAHQRSRRKREK